MNVLSLDIGTKTGWACNVGEVFDSGTWILATPKELKAIRPSRMDQRNDPRVHTLFSYLQAARTAVQPDFVIFENVEFSLYRLQTQLWASLRAAIWLAFPPGGLASVECVGVSTLKKFATGHGGATKDSMALALKMQLPKLWKESADDNEIDAIWLHQWAKTHIKI